jgi:Zn finger protein HypA/HybF involved in hydrogenase expression
MNEQGTTYATTEEQRNAIRVVAELLYTEFGATKVRKLAKLLEWKAEVACGQCDTTVPLIYTSAGDECMLCGSDDLAVWETTRR